FSTWRGGFSRMNSFKAFAVIALLVLASGCASVPMASKEDDAAAKTFSVPSDKSRIYVYRNEFIGGAVKIPITLDGRLVGSTVKNTYFALDTTPGSHDVGCIGETPGSVKVDLKAGEVAYIWQEMKMGMWAASCAMHVANTEEAQKAIAGCTLAVSQ
ncbi:MAG: DUF2846 domain-containing protein, partial [Betaproteobacteria bacterium]